MANGGAVQSATFRAIPVFWLLLVVVAGLFAGPGVVALFRPPDSNLDHAAIHLTAVGTTCLWFLGVRVALPRAPDDLGWRELSARMLRLAYTAGLAMCALHIAVAFHVGHAWSHRAAFDHVEAVGGYGWGLYVNYLFAAVWLFDAGWCWVSLDGYRSRPRWVNRLIHGFMAFIVFNATVVFGPPVTGVLCGIIFGMLTVEWLRGEWRAAPGRYPGQS